MFAKEEGRSQIWSKRDRRQWLGKFARLIRRGYKLEASKDGSVTLLHSPTITPNAPKGWREVKEWNLVCGWKPPPSGKEVAAAIKEHAVLLRISK